MFSALVITNVEKFQDGTRHRDEGDKNEEEEINDESIPELQRIKVSPLSQKLMMSQVRRRLQNQ